MSDCEEQKYVKQYQNVSPSIKVEVHHSLPESPGGSNTLGNSQVTINNEHRLCYFMENVQRIYRMGKPFFLVASLLPQKIYLIKTIRSSVTQQNYKLF